MSRCPQNMAQRSAEQGVPWVTGGSSLSPCVLNPSSGDGGTLLLNIQHLEGEGFGLQQARCPAQ